MVYYNNSTSSKITVGFTSIAYGNLGFCIYTLCAFIGILTQFEMLYISTLFSVTLHECNLHIDFNVQAS